MNPSRLHNLGTLLRYGSVSRRVPARCAWPLYRLGRWLCRRADRMAERF